MSEDILQIGETWHSDHCREKYNECLQRIQEIQEAARIQADPWIKLATDYKSMGSHPFVIVRQMP